MDRATLLGIAKHFETGETLSEEIYQKLLAARTFRAASQTLRQVTDVFLENIDAIYMQLRNIHLNSYILIETSVPHRLLIFCSS